MPPGDRLRVYGCSLFDLSSFFQFEEEAPLTTLAACLITLDEQEVLAEALASVDFCDELVVVDSGSTDRTLEIARRAGAKVIESEWRGFAVQRNLALEHARSDWVLELDADERVTPELRFEIESFLSSSVSDEYELAAMPIRQLFLGRPLSDSARYPDYRHRLFRRGAYHHDELRSVHEGLVPKGRVWALQNDLVHLLAGSLREATRDSLRYASLEADLIEGGSLRRALQGIMIRPPAKLFARMFVFRGWRDGWRGWLKIWLDCTTDALVWAHHLRGKRRPGPGRRGHFAGEQPAEGPPRLVALASKNETARAKAWLERAAQDGADVALLTGGTCGARHAAVAMRAIALGRLSALGTLRALDREWQLRPYDALVPFGSRARAIARRLPSRFRGFAGVIDPRGLDPEEGLSIAWRRREEGGGKP